MSPWAVVSPPFSKLTGYLFKDFKGQFDRMRSLLYQLTLELINGWHLRIQFSICYLREGKSEHTTALYLQSS